MPTSNLPGRRHTFRKQERLVSRCLFELLISGGKTLNEEPFRLVWKKQHISVRTPVQAAFSVPKKNFKLAVDRNRVKRLMREAYRKNKHSMYALLEQQHIQCIFLWIYSGKILPAYSETEKKIKIILHRFVEDIQKNSR
ncbi:MAG: ribonuclease P protein component [Bacteroidia bacterium]|nr:ribonuclease P protein component [Bacteroidia bacterium]